MFTVGGSGKGANLLANSQSKSLFEKLGAFVPGYTGYSEREGRRDTDKLLRLAVAKKLDHLKEFIDNVIRQQITEKNIDLINDLDRLKRNLDIAANQIRHANYGESGFFDVVQVESSDLDRLYQFDLSIKEEVVQLSAKVNALQSSDNLKVDLSSVLNGLTALSSRMSNRDQVITEVR